MVLNSIPRVTEKLSFGAPFYFLHSRIVYIWPGSIPWGGTKTMEGVQIGFCKGHALSDTSWLDRESCKEVFTKKIYRPEEIISDIVKAYLFEAVEIDKLFAQHKRQKSMFKAE